MTIRNLPIAPVASSRPGVSCDITPKALEHWNRAISAADQDDDATISIFDPIGYDPWSGDGVTAKRISAALRSLNGKDVVVNINSPGGDVYEGLAIYNLFREYKGKVTMRVLGVAASAASFLAMAGDEIQIARAAFFMIHNAWVMAVGNRHDLRDVADWLEPFDKTITEIYVARTGGDAKAVQKQMDAETWLGGSDAVAQGFADSLLASDAIAEVEDEDGASNAAHRLDVLLARGGVPRSERRKLIQEIKTGTPSAAGNGTRDAADSVSVPTDLIAGLKSALERLGSIAN